MEERTLWRNFFLYFFFKKNCDFYVRFPSLSFFFHLCLQKLIDLFSFFFFVVSADTRLYAYVEYAEARQDDVEEKKR